MSSRLWARLLTFDRLVLSYSAAMIAVLLLIGRPVSHYVEEMLFYVFAVGVSVAIPNMISECHGRVWLAVRYFYPVLLLTFFYRAAGGTIFLLFDGFMDNRLTAFEASVLGLNPTLFIDQHLLHPVLNELFSLGYFLYYPLIPAFVLIVYLRGEIAVLRSSLSSVCLGFFMSYPLFFLYPIEGPRWFFAEQYVNAVESPISRHLCTYVMDHAAFRGGCMPSSHFAVALVILLYCHRYYRRAFWGVLPIVATMAVGTFWGRFHYVSDVIVGGVIGVIATVIFWNQPAQQGTTVTPSTPKEPATQHVS